MVAKAWVPLVGPAERWAGQAQLGGTVHLPSVAKGLTGTTEPGSTRYLPGPALAAPTVSPSGVGSSPATVRGLQAPDGSGARFIEIATDHLTEWAILGTGGAA